MSEGKKGEGLSHGGGCEWGLQWKDVGVRVWFTDRGDGGDGVHKGEERVCGTPEGEVWVVEHERKLKVEE